MSKVLHNELRKEFQLERLILFSDAVFAIAITLLVIEIKIPEVHGQTSDEALKEALMHLIPKFVGFIVSFIFIGLYWVIHHRMFSWVVNYDMKLLRLNLIFLFFIVLMPFSTGFYSEYGGSELVRDQLKVPMTFYVLNFSLAGILNFFIWSHISNPRKKLTEEPLDPNMVRMGKIRSLTVPLIFLLMIPVAYKINILIAIYIPLLIPIIMFILKKIFLKKNVHAKQA